MPSISSGGQPCMVDRVTEFVIRWGISMSASSGYRFARMAWSSAISAEAS